MNYRTGLTLMELVVVLAILGLLTSMVTLNARAVLGESSMEGVLSDVEAYDAQARHRARRRNARVHLAIDLSANRMAAEDVDGSPLGAPLQLPDDFYFARWRVGQRESHTGYGVLWINPEGYTPDYALEVEAPDGERHWIVFAGLTGHSARVSDATNVQDILVPKAARDDAR